MNGFRLIARVSPASHHVYVHIRALVMRDGDWAVCGVFQLLSSEWAPFRDFCRTHGIEVEFEAPAIPTEPSTPAEAE